MAFGKKKKKRKFEPSDDFGSKVPPFSSERDTLDSMGSYAIMERSSKSIAVGKVLTKLLVAFTAVILGAAIISPVFFSSRINDLEKTISGMESPSFKSRYDELGKAVIQAYYSKQNPPVNLMKTATWSTPLGDEEDGVESSSSAVLSNEIFIENLALIDTPKTAPVSPSGNDGSVFTNPYSEVLVYSGYVDGKLYRFSVNFIVPNKNDYTILPYLAAAPNMLPMTDVVQGGEGSIDTPMVGTNSPYTAISLNEVSLKVIRDWASAYAQDDYDSLKRITGDRNPAHMYRGIGGFRLEGNPVVVWSYSHNAGTPKEEEDDAIVARIMFNMVKRVKNNSNTAESSVLGQSETVFNQIQTFDIILQNHQTGTANITSWGPAGSWPNLAQFSNAINITKEEFDALNSGEATNGLSTPIVTDEEDDANDVVPTLTSQTKATVAPSDDENSDDEGSTSTSKKKKSSGSSTKDTAEEDLDDESKANEIIIPADDDK